MEICSGRPLTYYNGTHHILVGVTSYGFPLCGLVGKLDQFARVSHVMDWIRKHGDYYVNSCSARVPKI